MWRVVIPFDKFDSSSGAVPVAAGKGSYLCRNFLIILPLHDASKSLITSYRTHRPMDQADSSLTGQRRRGRKAMEASLKSGGRANRNNLGDEGKMETEDEITQGK